MAFEAAFEREPLQYLAFLDGKHDFKALLGTDRPNQKRGAPADERHYWQTFTTSILRSGMGLSPKYSSIFNGCPPIVTKYEELGVENALRLSPQTRAKFDYESSDAFYTQLAAHLNPYKVGGKIPIVVDVQFSLAKDRLLNGLINNFVICKNKEHYADPGRTYKQDFGAATAIESGARSRTYTENILYSGLGSTIVAGEAGNVEITYGQSGVKNTYLEAQKILANSIGLCRSSFNTLLKTGDYMKRGDEINYCKLFREDKDLPGGYDMGLTTRMAAHIIKKRLGDQLQVASCRQEISYTQNGRETTYGGAKPCVFWSYDRLAVAYAMLLKVPCVLQLPNKNIEVFLPRGQSGGACTRLELTAAAAAGGDDPIVKLINTNSDCLNRYVEQHFEPGSPCYDPLNCLAVLKAFGILDAGSQLFTEAFAIHAYHDVPQLYVEGEDVIARLNEDPRLAFFSAKHQVAILHAGHEFVVYKGDAMLCSFTNTVLTSHLPPDQLISFFTQEGGYSKGSKTTKGSKLTKLSKTSKGSILDLLSIMSYTEKLFLVFPDSRELFYAGDKNSFVQRGGYVCYDLIFFLKGLVKAVKQDNLRCTNLTNILKELGEDELLESAELFMSSFMDYKHSYRSSSSDTECVTAIKRILEESKKAARAVEAHMATLKTDAAMINYLDQTLPIGIINKLYKDVARQGSLKSRAKVSGTRPKTRQGTRAKVSGTRGRISGTHQV